MEKDFLKLMLHENIKQLFYFQKKYVIANFGNDALDFISMGIINIQGCNARKVISEVYKSAVYCLWAVM